AIFCALFALNLCCGDLFVTPAQLVACFQHLTNDVSTSAAVHAAVPSAGATMAAPLDDVVKNIVLEIRLPRVLIAIVVGAALSLAGLVLQ
ncbi:iron chelate uptake ABC transporter family permease subunit, partial [Acinetobacter baumannii]